MERPVSTLILPPPAAHRPAAPPRNRDLRALICRVTIVLVVGLLLTGPGGLAYLAAPLADAGTAQAELHRWHSTDIGALVTLLLSGGLAVCARRPRGATVPVQAVLLSLLGFASLAIATPAPAAVLLPAAVVAGLLVAVVPEPRALWRVPRLGTCRPALLGAIIATPFLAANLWQNVVRQLDGVDAHAALGHWSGAGALAFALLVSTWLATSDGRGARALSGVAGMTWSYLGIAALLLPLHDGSWGTVGGLLALVVAALLLAGARRRPLRPGRGRR